jgi:pimeloyl-ACP methyl ester carboxylesterase
MKTVQSKDGTKIGYARTGSGPPLLLIHGTTDDHTRWAPTLPALEEHFTVYAMNRRGRGGSGDSITYRLEDEVADVVALIDEGSAGGKVDVVAYSYGAICAIEAGRQRASIGRLVLYEPPVQTSAGAYFTAEMVEQIRALIAANDRDRALTTFLAEVVKAPERQIATMKASPGWDDWLRRAHVILREMEGVRNYKPEEEDFSGWTLPTLFLLGGNSEPRYRASIDHLMTLMPGGKLAILKDQGHFAFSTAPDLLARKILAFLG